MPVNDGPESDGHDLDFIAEADDDETAALRPLFPDGVAHDDWHQIFGDVTPA